MEKVYTQNNTYRPRGTTPALGDDADAIFTDKTPIDGSSKYYSLSISAISEHSFTLRATPITGTGQSNDGIIEVDNTGSKRWDKNNNNEFDAGEDSWN